MQITHKDDLNGKVYINVRSTSAATAKPVYIRKYVDEENVYCLTRHYRYSKSNNFSNMIATVRCVKNSVPPNKYYLYLNRWIGDQSEIFNIERHGNATKPHVNAYYKKDKSVLTNVRSVLADGVAPDEVYVKVSQQNCTTSSVSEMLNTPKVVHNAKHQMQRKEKTVDTLTEAESLINLLHNGSIVRSIRFTGECYMSFNYMPFMLHELYRFCCLGNSALVIDTTFKVADKLWLTDSSYTNETLIDDKYPTFPGTFFNIYYVKKFLLPSQLPLCTLYFF